MTDYSSLFDNPDVWMPYRYYPSKAAAISFFVAFTLTTVLHVWQSIRRKTWYFIPMIIGGIFEVSGCVGRFLSSEDLMALGPFIVQSLLMLVAPALFAASIYIILGRIILLVDGEKYSLVRRRWLTRVFVTGDIVSFLAQCCGGGIQAAGSLKLLHAGEKIIIVGLFLQIAFFGVFIVVAGSFHSRLERANRALTITPSNSIPANNLPWKRHMYALYTASALIMIRSIFRVIEYLQGNNGFLLRREIFLYVFDASLMLIVMTIFNYIHPSEISDLYHKRLSHESEGIVLQDMQREYYYGSSSRLSLQGRRSGKHLQSQHALL